MPGCAAIHCTNSSVKGFLMKRFPRDPIRRKQWRIKCRRDNWTPSNNSYLCEAHFAPDMWEKTREDGTRKLKSDATPTLFSFSKQKQSRKPPTQRFLQPKNLRMPPIHRKLTKTESSSSHGVTETATEAPKPLNADIPKSSTSTADLSEEFLINKIDSSQ
ncbi:THAP domain-containing protein 2-like isoform X2 [Photinus pyralis]|nr:THAP domain-containing protein 2-like isoform X2 [Photinus pyralis]XP_031329307.1 THAP domain-containing protein 2-like isoform X2 [Photinus pyralis]